ncbi:NAD(P)-dependent oxidoreductase [Paenibacillus tritici]|uniref:NAD(P)-dependent oxidoreductase n=2 Tax=Paenibacillus tritici TaxID=1873425 RepID=A0ABX2DV16_9BACL|nr:NAD(P)-dependent oxidoreductase [Paenibacillus tritici]
MAKKKRIMITGAAGNMGGETLKLLKNDLSKCELLLFDLDNPNSRQKLKEYEGLQGVKVVYGNLLDRSLVYDCVKDADIILHIAAFVSPAADEFPERAMQINYGSAKNIIDSIIESGRAHVTRFVNIGTIAETGDRMPPIHWGRVGDPLKPSVYDYYAVSKIAAERMVIESGLSYWVSLRQTGIMGPAMSKIQDPIMFHNCLDNVLEYVSDRDSGRLMRNLCIKDIDGELNKGFWQHVYNIGGGESCRISTTEMYRVLYGKLGITNLDYVIDPKWYATRNFHGQYYLDSDKLEEYFHFRRDSVEYFYQSYLDNLGSLVPVAKVITKLPGGQRFMGSMIKRTMKKQAVKARGTLRFIEDNDTEKIDAYWGSKKNWGEIPDKLSEVKGFTDWKKAIKLDHGYDENKPAEQLNLEDLKGAAKFRGGECLSTDMTTGDWTRKLDFKCAFGHTFSASPKLVLEGGHFCPQCERESWNYKERAKREPFFAQVWYPLQGETDGREYKKIVSELDAEKK